MNTERPLRHPISTLAAPNPGWGLPFARRRCPMACRSTPERSPAITARSQFVFHRHGSRRPTAGQRWWGPGARQSPVLQAE